MGEMTDERIKGLNDVAWGGLQAPRRHCLGHLSRGRWLEGLLGSLTAYCRRALAQPISQGGTSGGIRRYKESPGPRRQNSCWRRRAIPSSPYTIVNCSFPRPTLRLHKSPNAKNCLVHRLWDGRVALRKLTCERSTRSSPFTPARNGSRRRMRQMGPTGGRRAQATPSTAWPQNWRTLAAYTATREGRPATGRRRGGRAGGSAARWLLVTMMLCPALPSTALPLTPPHCHCRAARRRAITELLFFASVGDLRRCKRIVRLWNLKVGAVLGSCSERAVLGRSAWAWGALKVGAGGRSEVPCPRLQKQVFYVGEPCWRFHSPALGCKRL